MKHNEEKHIAYLYVDNNSNWMEFSGANKHEPVGTIPNAKCGLEGYKATRTESGSVINNKHHIWLKDQLKFERRLFAWTFFSSK